MKVLIKSRPPQPLVRFLVLSLTWTFIISFSGSPRLAFANDMPTTQQPAAPPPILTTSAGPADGTMPTTEIAIQDTLTDTMEPSTIGPVSEEPAPEIMGGVLPVSIEQETPVLQEVQDNATPPLRISPPSNGPNLGQHVQYVQQTMDQTYSPFGDIWREEQISADDTHFIVNYDGTDHLIAQVKRGTGTPDFPEAHWYATITYYNQPGAILYAFDTYTGHFIRIYGGVAPNNNPPPPANPPSANPPFLMSLDAVVPPPAAPQPNPPALPAEPEASQPAPQPALIQVTTAEMISNSTVINIMVDPSDNSVHFIGPDGDEYTFEEIQGDIQINGVIPQSVTVDENDQLVVTTASPNITLTFPVHPAPAAPQPNPAVAPAAPPAPAPAPAPAAESPQLISAINLIFTLHPNPVLPGGTATIYQINPITINGHTYTNVIVSANLNGAGYQFQFQTALKEHPLTFVATGISPVCPDGQVWIYGVCVSEGLLPPDYFLLLPYEIV